jgi:hypothetical protein
VGGGRGARTKPADPGLEAVENELRAREPIFHRPELGTSREAFEALTAPDYWEVGASGRAYTREVIWTELARRYADPGYASADAWSVTDFAVREAGAGVWLAMYVLRQGDRLTRRLTVWRRTPDGWQAHYHQGTVVSGTDALEALDG